MPRARDNDGMLEDPGLSWSQLKAFEACVRLANFSTAAAALGLTASAVRYQIGLLEDRLGVRLFDRNGGRLAPTAAGADLAQQIARPMRDLVRACANATRRADEEPLTLTAPPLFARQFLFGPRFLKWCDANAVVLDIADVKRDLFASAPIAAIRLGAEPEADLVLVDILEVSVVLAAAPSIADEARPKDREWWANQVLIGTGVSDAGWPSVWEALGLPPIKPTRTHRFASYAAALEAAAGGRGVILAPLPFSEAEFSSRRLSRISDVRWPASIRYCLAMKKDLAASRKGRALRKMIASTIAADVARIGA